MSAFLNDFFGATAAFERQHLICIVFVDSQDVMLECTSQLQPELFLDGHRTPGAHLYFEKTHTRFFSFMTS